MIGFGMIGILLTFPQLAAILPEAAPSLVKLIIEVGLINRILALIYPVILVVFFLQDNYQRTI